MMNAVIYARYSSSKQREASIEDQVAECRRYADTMDFHVIDVYADRAVSGQTDRREAFQRMIEDSRKHRFQYVIVYSLDRFARLRLDHAVYKDKLRRNGVSVCYATQPISDSPEGIILESVLEGYSEYYSAELRRKVTRGLTHNAEHGLSVGGGLPFGISVKDKRYVINEETAPAVRKAFEMYAEGHSIQDIIAWLNQRGYRTTRGLPFGKSSLARMLGNRRYIGEYMYNGIVYKDHPALIDAALFERVQQKRSINAVAKAHNKSKVDFMLTTKLFCGHCGMPMTGDSGTSATSETYFYYKCSGRKRRVCQCNKRTEQKEPLEVAIVQETVRRVLTPEVIDEIADAAHELAVKEAEDNSVLESCTQRLRQVESSLKNLMRAIESGIFTETTRARLEELEKEKADLNYQIGVEKSKQPPIEKERIVFWLRHFIGGDATDERYRRMVVETLINRVTVYDDDDGHGRRVEVACNLSGDNTFTFKSSDTGILWPPNAPNPNFFFHLRKLIFGFTFYFDSKRAG